MQVNFRARNSLVQEVLVGAQRALTQCTNKKEPITVSQLWQVVVLKAVPSTSPNDLRSVALCLLSFAVSVLHFDDLAKLR